MSANMSTNNSEIFGEWHQKIFLGRVGEITVWFNSLPVIIRLFKSGNTEIDCDGFKITMPWSDFVRIGDYGSLIVGEVLSRMIGNSLEENDKEWIRRNITRRKIRQMIGFVRRIKNFSN